jgi:hypothetical protein
VCIERIGVFVEPVGVQLAKLFYGLDLGLKASFMRLYNPLVKQHNGDDGR